MIINRCLVVCALLVGCTQENLVLIHTSERTRTPPQVRAACTVTEQKCSRCHDLERIRMAHHAMVDWPMYVDRMRRQPASGISAADTPVILRCLEHMKSLQRERDAYVIEH